MLDISKVHHYEKIPGEFAVRLRRTTPYVRLFRDGEVPIFLQYGQFHYEDGTVIPDSGLPIWLKDELKKCNPKVLAECGLKDSPSKSNVPRDVSSLNASRPARRVPLNFKGE